MKPFLSDTDLTVYLGDVTQVLQGLPDASVDCVITSPPYWGLRDYGTAVWVGGDDECDHLQPVGGVGKSTLNTGTVGSARKSQETQRVPFKHECGRCGAVRQDEQIGLEATPDLYVERIVAVFQEIHRVIAPHGTVWLNLGDSYATRGQNRSDEYVEQTGGNTGLNSGNARTHEYAPIPQGLKAKDLVGIPWMVAFALRADGWYLRSDIIWSKPNPMPESAKDRPTSAHEHIFLLTRRSKYFYDQEAVKEPAVYERWGHQNGPGKYEGANSSATMIGNLSKQDILDKWGGKRNKRNVWSVVTEGYPDAHFATFPPKLIEPCVLAGCPSEVCRTCGKPRERIVDRQSSWEPRKEAGATAGNLGVSEVYQGGVHGEGVSHDLDGQTRTIGWSDCGHNNYRRWIVMDPFAGSGTTGLVARNQERHALLIELNPEYGELIRARLQQLSLLA